MSAILDAANEAFRDYDTDGVPASGAHKPVKGEIRDVFGLIQTSVDGINGVFGGAVTMFTPEGQMTGAWSVVDPFGNFVDTTGTTTSGLQEAINYSVNNGFPLRVFGHGCTTVSQQTGTLNSTDVVTGLDTSDLTDAIADGRIYVTGDGIPPFTWISTIDNPSQITLSSAATKTGSKALRFAQNLVFLSCTTGIQVPPAEQWSCRFEDVNITFSTGVTGPCFSFDSCMVVNFEYYGGQIVGQPSGPGGSSYLVYFNPTNPVPLDGTITITGSRFFINNTAYPASGGQAQAVFAWNISKGSIVNNFFGSTELNGTGTGLSPDTLCAGLVFGATSTTAFEQNIIDFADVHLAASAGIQIGVSTSFAANYRHNNWRIGGIRPGASATCVSTYGCYDQFYIGACTNEEAGGNVAQGITFQSSAVGNVAIVGQMNGITTPVTYAGASNAVCISGQWQLPAGNGIAHVAPSGQLSLSLGASGTPATTVETDLKTYTMPANTLDAVGRKLKIKAWGTTGANANGKTVRLYLGATAIYNSTTLTTNNGNWVLEAEIYKTGSNTQSCWGTSVFVNSTPATQVSDTAITDTAGIIIKVTGQNSVGNLNDIVCKGMSVEMLN